MRNPRPLSVVILVAIVSLIVSTDNTFAQQGFVEQLIPPEFIVEHKAEIGLSDEQHQKIAAIADEFGSQAVELQKDVGERNSKLGELLRENTADEATTIKQMKAFLASDQKLKQHHFTAMIRIRNVLTAKQRVVLLEKLKTHKTQQPPGQSALQSAPSETEKRLRRKVAQIKVEVDGRAANGTPPLEAVKTMETFSQAMRHSRVQEAEAILDRVMKMLNIRPDAVPQDSQEQSAVLPREPESVTRLTRQPTESLAEIKQSVSALHVEDVAWRKIEWETCLLQGLQRSRMENKPLILWVFIDRPIDDERC